MYMLLLYKLFLVIPFSVDCLPLSLSAAVSKILFVFSESQSMESPDSLSDGILWVGSWAGGSKAVLNLYNLVDAIVYNDNEIDVCVVIGVGGCTAHVR